MFSKSCFFAKNVCILLSNLPPLQIFQIFEYNETDCQLYLYQIKPDDPFGQQMVRNLEVRNEKVQKAAEGRLLVSKELKVL